MSDSDSSDENLQQEKLLSVIDCSLFNDKFYESKEGSEKKTEKPKTDLKSQRYLDDTENIFQSELNVSDNMKNFIGKKMQKIIEESTEYVDINYRSKNDTEEDRVRLLKGTKEFISLEQDDFHYIQQRKIPIKRRNVDSQDGLKESSKIKEAVVDIDKINQEVNHWDKRNRHKVIKYKKAKDEKCHLIEEPNEYLKSRSRNGWTESKIKSAKYFNQGLCSVINKK